MAAARQLGWTEIAAVVRDETDSQAYLLTLTENLQREDLSPKEEAEALEVLVRERGWTTRQIGQAIKRSHIYVNRRLRVFEDDVLVGPVLAGQLAVSTAEELLHAEPEARPTFVERAITEEWGQTEARRAVLECNVPRVDGALERRLKKLRHEVLTVDLEHLSPSTRTEAKKLLDALRPLASKSRAYA